MTSTQATQKSLLLSQSKLIYIWLFVCCATVFCMILVGAITRLTESGLSIVEWKPLIGAIPPLNEKEWQRIFDLYKATPEFQKKNFWMNMDDFKHIFFWEWFHRLLGRVIGMIFALPYLFFLVKGIIPKGYKLKFLGIFILGGLQGAMGWYMVKSGLVNMPSVSHYRLAAHLALALVLYALMFWSALDFMQLSKKEAKKQDLSLYKHGWITLGFVMITIFWGAYTAGLDAGLVYNDTFPKMGESWIPSEVFFYKPTWVNFFENPAGVQFTHRWLAMTTALVVLSFAIRSIKRGYKEFRFAALGFFVFIQIGLGISTLLSGVNIVLAVMHQGGAVVLLSLLLTCLHRVRGNFIPE